MNRRLVAAGLTALVIGVCAWPLAVFSMKHYLPEVDNDEVMYFLLVKVFRSQGFHGGYSFVNDRIPASGIHFDMHGPGTVPFYSALAHVVGWTNYSPYLANLLLFVASWLLLAYALRRRPLNQIATALFVLANGYFFIFLPSAMQESFHISVAIAVAALWYIAAEQDSAIAWVALFAVVGTATLVRYAWALVVPFLVFSLVMQRMKAWRTPGRVLTAGAAGLLVGGFVSAVAVKLTLWWAVPPVPASQQVFAVPRIADGFSAARLQTNVDALIHFKMMRMLADYPRFFVVSLGLTLAVFVAVAIRARGFGRARSAALYASAIVLSSTAAQLLFYAVDGWREFRVLAPAHALAGLVFFANVDPVWPAWKEETSNLAAGGLLMLIVLNAIFTVQGLEQKYWYNWTHRAPGIDQNGQAIFAALAPHFEFHPDDSSFCKTTYGDSEVLADPRLVYLPDGFALSVLEPDAAGQLPAVHGKYALVKKLNPDTHALFDWVVAFSQSSQWRRIATADDFTLYRSTVNCLS